jgi:nitrate reductase gamma subunit
MEKSSKMHWFRPKKYGLGWVPITLQGWLVTFGYAFFLGGSVILFTRRFSSIPVALGSTPASDVIIVGFLLWIVLITGIMLWVCYKTGEPLEWH